MKPTNEATIQQLREKDNPEGCAVPGGASGEYTEALEYDRVES